jgi:excisionase family DNA binding protein
MSAPDFLDSLFEPKGDPKTRTEDTDRYNDIMTIEEVAEYLRLTPQTIYKWAQEKRIPATKLGKEWRFRKSIIDRWLDDKMLGSGNFKHLERRR